MWRSSRSGLDNWLVAVFESHGVLLAVVPRSIVQDRRYALGGTRYLRVDWFTGRNCLPWSYRGLFLLAALLFGLQGDSFP